MIDMNNDIAYIMIEESVLDAKIREIAKQVDAYYRETDKRVLLIGILKGSVVFLTELMKRLTIPVELDFMKVSSYGHGTESSGRVNITLDINRTDISNIDILIIEDIADSGRTLANLKRHLIQKGANSVRTCVLLDKPARREVKFDPDYRGFIIEDEFVVGFGLDYDEKYRNLPYIGVLKPAVYTHADNQ